MTSKVAVPASKPASSLSRSAANPPPKLQPKPHSQPPPRRTAPPPPQRSLPPPPPLPPLPLPPPHAAFTAPREFGPDDPEGWKRDGWMAPEGVMRQSKPVLLRELPQPKVARSDEEKERAAAKVARRRRGSGLDCELLAIWSGC